jgi:RES domain-containing protein
MLRMSRLDVNLHAWRIVKARHASSAFTGEGARRFGGRWNSPGVAVIYAAATTSLALLEMLVHIQDGDLLPSYVLFRVRFSSNLVSEFDRRQLPRNWRSPAAMAATRVIGDTWVAKAQSPVLAVPSVIVPHERNYLINPAHPHYARVARGPKQPLRLDPRLR